MSLLRSIEQRVEGLVEGLFGRAFRTPVQPIELARKLAKEMDDHRTISVSRVYVPNEYTVYLSPPDREQFVQYEASLRQELAGYLTEHARREGYALLSPPLVLVEQDEDLAIGEFGIATRTAEPERAQAEPGSSPAASDPGATRIFTPPSVEAANVAAPGLGELAVAPGALVVGNERHELGGERTVVGRGRDCDLTVEDPNISRHHAEIRREQGAYWIVDLRSTNGVEVNGQQVERSRLEDGDTIVLGRTEIQFVRSGI